jgi:hypothetical protein
VLPNAHDTPTAFSQLFRYQSITSGIPGNLLYPVFGIVDGQSAMFRTAVPKAAINKESDAACSESEIGTAG